MKVIKFIICSYSIILLFSCSMKEQKRGKNNWQLVNTAGLQESNESFSTILFLNDFKGFLFGTNTSDNVILNKEFYNANAVIYSTDDGGISWTPIVVGKGEFVDASKADDLIYAITNVSSKSAYALIDSSILYVSTDSGIVWETRFTFPFFIRDISFANSQIGVVIGRDQRKANNSWTVLKTSDGGLKWDYLFESKTLSEPIIHKDELLYLYQLMDDEWEIIRMNISTELRDSLTLPVNFYPDKILIDSNDRVFVIGTIGNDVIIYYQDNDGNFILLSDFKVESGFPLYFNCVGGNLYVIVGILENTLVNYKCFLYSDEGKWFEEKLVIDNNLKPVYFGRNKIWGYSGAGRIQIRE